MNLMFVIKSVDVSGGGAERVLADVVGALSSRGHAVTVVTADREGGVPFYEYPASVEFVRCGIGHVDKSSGWWETFRRVKKYRAVAMARNVDVAVGFMHSSYLPLGAALLNTGIPVVASEHIVYEHYANKPLQKLALGLVPFLTSAMTVISEKIRDGFPDKLRQSITIIPNPVAAVRNPELPVPKRNVIVAVGRLVDQKDQGTLVAAFAQVAQEFPEWTLRIVGEGPLRATLEELVAKYSLAGRVELPGSIGNISAEYQAASLFAMPSLYESFGLATAEALAHSLPAIGFADCEGTNALIVDGVNGLLVGGGNRADCLADGLRHLMQSQELRNKLGHAGPESVQKYALASVCDRWENLLHAVKQKNTGSFSVEHN